MSLTYDIYNGLCKSIIEQLFAHKNSKLKKQDPISHVGAKPPEASIKSS